MGTVPHLRPYQEEAATSLYERDRALALAPVGAGKTAIALTAMREMLADDHASRFLVLAPLRVCDEVWAQERDKWAPGLPLAVATGSPERRARAFNSSARVVVTNYDNIQRLPDLSSFDGIVFDELTRLKNPSGKRWKALEKAIRHIGIRWGLTGSFTSNGLEDVYGQCRIVSEKILGRTKGAFMQQYFWCVNRDFGQWEPMPDALEKVMARIKPWTFVMEGSSTDRELHTVPVWCEMENRDYYESMKREFVLNLDGRDVTALSAATLTGKLQQIAGGFVYHTDWQDDSREALWIGDHKFDRLDEILEENQHANTLVAYWFKEELAELQRRYPDARTLDDPDAVERWNAGDIRLLLAHPRSAGHGLNLQRGGHHVVFTSLPWSLELYEQTIGRLHRSGQTHDVWCYVLLTSDTIDERIWAALHDKRSISDLALEELASDRPTADVA